MTQYEKILVKMLSGPRDKWWLPQEFMRDDHELFVGYEASARLSELARDYPTMIETRQEGKFRVRRIRTENVDDWLPRLPEYIQQTIRIRFGAEQ